MKNLGGRPPFFQTPAELDILIEKYFKEHKEEKKYTISGLALALGFASRQSLYDYEAKLEFTYSIKRARFSIENRIEELMLYGKQNPDINLAGLMLWLKTHAGYTDRQVDKGDNKDPADVNAPQRQSREEWEKSQQNKQ